MSQIALNPYKFIASTVAIAATAVATLSLLLPLSLLLLGEDIKMNTRRGYKDEYKGWWRYGETIKIRILEWSENERREKAIPQKVYGLLKKIFMFQILMELIKKLELNKKKMGQV